MDDAPDPADIGSASDAGAPDDSVLPVPDAKPDLSPGTCHPLVNEVQTGSTAAATEAFIEIFNPCSTAAAVEGWKIVYRSTAGVTDVTIGKLTGVAPARGYLVYGGTDWTGVRDGRLSASLAKKGGGVGLRDAAGTLVDSLGYGTATNAFVKTRAAPTPPLVGSPGNSISRIPNGVDTEDNGADFRVSTVATPKGPNR